jgi:hypothetical protein
MTDTLLNLVDQILPTLLYLVALALIYYGRVLLKTWLPKIEAWIDTNVSVTTKKLIRDLGSEAFTYAETVYRDKNGADKLREALSYFNSHMSKYGLANLTTEVIRAAIERAWLDDKRKEMPVIEAVQLEAVRTE